MGLCLWLIQIVISFIENDTAISGNLILDLSGDVKGVPQITEEISNEL